MKSSKQLKDLINNKAQKYNLSPQILLTRFFLERFLERISLSEYKNKFILKGGILISSMIGVDLRMTSDIDITTNNFTLNKDYITTIIINIANIKIEDSVNFKFIDIHEIRENFDYTGYRVRLRCELDKTTNIISLDISTGDIITPKAIEYDYELLLEKRKINLICYPIETILAEKLESILSKNILTTRMKDFYDCYKLGKLYQSKIKWDNLLQAIKNTAKIRNTEFIFNNTINTIQLIANDETLKNLWEAYSLQYDYSKNIKFEDTLKEIFTLLKNIKLV